MTHEHIATLLEEALLDLEAFAAGCAVPREWVIDHVRAGVLLSAPDPDPARWLFSGRDILRTRRLVAVERDFDANPELAGLVADLFDELERLRTRLRTAGLRID